MSSMRRPKRAYNLFYCYADKDDGLLDQLDSHLSTLMREGEIKTYDRRDILAGNNREDELTTNMDKSSIILLLISSHFISSDYNYSREMQYAIQRRKANKAIIIPIILRPCNWKNLPFGEDDVLSDYEVLPRSHKAVTKWPNRDEAFSEITQAIRQAVQNLREYAEEINMNQGSSKPKSIYSDQANPEQHKPIKTNQAGPKQQGTIKMSQTTPTTTAKQRTSGRQATNAQIAKPSYASASWGKKSLKKSWLDSFLSFDELTARSRGNLGIVTLIFFLIDVFGLAIYSQEWLKSQQLPIFVFVISFLMYTWGILNIKPYIAFLLTAAYCVVWLFVGFYYLRWHPLVILVLVFVSSIVHFILFRKHEKIKLSIR